MSFRAMRALISRRPAARPAGTKDRVRSRTRAAIVAALAVSPVVWACSHDPVRPTPTAEFVPASVAFPATALGDTARVAVSLVSLVGWNQTVGLTAPSGEFSLSGAGTSFVLRAGQAVELEARFHPSWEGVMQTEFVVEGAICSSLACRGSGKEDPCRVEPAALMFGRLDPGEERTLRFTVYCDGPDAVSGKVASACPEFTVTEGAGSFHLAPGESLRVAVRYAPRDLGEDACTVMLGATWCEPVKCTGRASNTWRVEADGSGDAPTVQAGIDSARHGDVVLVGPGRYYETINLRGKRIHLLGERGRDATILDGSRGNDSVVVCESGETNDTVIEGFTITGGKGRVRAIDGRMGAGVLCLGATPVIENNAIVGNSAITPPGGNQSRGGGLLYSWNNNPEVYGRGLILRRNVIRDNFASNHGGGVYLSSACTVENNLILDNRAGTDGGGMYLVRAWILVRGNVIAGNTGGDHGGGIYIWKGFEPPPPRSNEITENLIIGNYAWGIKSFGDCSGGAIWAYEGAWIHNNTIIFNTAKSSKSLGAGGICLFATSDGTIVENNLIYRNNEGGVVASWWASGKPQAAEVRRNLLSANGQPNIYNNQPDQFELRLQENVLANPLLCVDGPESDGRLAENSPALNQPWGVIGAVVNPGCGPMDTAPGKGVTTWGVIHSRHGP